MGSVDTLSTEPASDASRSPLDRIINPGDLSKFLPEIIAAQRFQTGLCFQAHLLSTCMVSAGSVQR